MDVERAKTGPKQQKQAIAGKVGGILGGGEEGGVKG